MNIAVVNTLPIPCGEASVNRILSYTQELVKLGNSVTILSSAYSTQKDGVINGVFFYCFGRSENKVLSLFRSLLDILRNIKKKKYNVVILVSNSLSLIYPLVITCRLRGITLLQEKSEYPFILRKKGWIWSAIASIYVNTTYRVFDGLIVMTKPLMEYFKDKVNKKATLFEMPMTVDVDRFSIQKKSSLQYGDYIAYCGNMTGNKDGVLNLIEAFSQIEGILPKITLLLIGGTNQPEQLERLKKQVKEKGVKHIVFYGRATRDEIPELLVNAKLLALARPSSLQSTGGFPTKLGEYLATGNPVVVTKIGDIPNYLNEENAFLVEPDDNKAFANAILSVFENYEKAKAIGEKGKELALTVFNSKVQSERLNNYLHSLV